MFSSFNWGCLVLLTVLLTGDVKFFYLGRFSSFNWGGLVILTGDVCSASAAFPISPHPSPLCEGRLANKWFVRKVPAVITDMHAAL